MLTNIIPAASFTAATTAPSLLGRATDVVHWLSGHEAFFVIFLLTAAVVLLVGWAFRRDTRQQQTATIVTAPPQQMAPVVALPARGEN